MMGGDRRKQAQGDQDRMQPSTHTPVEATLAQVPGSVKSSRFRVYFSVCRRPSKVCLTHGLRYFTEDSTMNVGRAMLLALATAAFAFAGDEFAVATPEVGMDASTILSTIG